MFLPLNLVIVKRKKYLMDLVERLGLHQDHVTQLCIRDFFLPNYPVVAMVPEEPTSCHKQSTPRYFHDRVAALYIFKKPFLNSTC
ncbi:hypothetical protein Scep_012598 [Stephania cephalantha]|uniref:Uncharacterized protein n=1 Tax=Stephania cephalantha TaxID=152367 RepID=A0AAP0JG90_9MAGN